MKDITRCTKLRTPLLLKSHYERYYKMYKVENSTTIEKSL